MPSARSDDPQTAIRSFRIDSDDEPTSRFFEVADVARPAGAATQWLSFRFRSEGLSRHSPGSHFAVILQARLVRDAHGRPSALSGRGIALGNTIEAFASESNTHALGHPGFGGARGMVLESFWPGGNFLYRDAVTLDAPLEDGRDYFVHIHARIDRWFSAWLDEDDKTATSRIACVRDSDAHPVIEASGILIVLARGGGETGAWSVSFDEIGYGWF